MAAAGVRNIKIKFDGSTKGLADATKNGQKQLSKWERGLQKMNKVANRTLLGVGAAVGGMVKKTAEAGDRIDKTASKMGVTTDALQEMEFWAEQNGLAQDQLEKAVGRLNQRVGRAAAGNQKYADAFKDIGVAVKDSNGEVREAESVMQDTIAALRNIENPAERSAATMEVFGTKLGRDLQPVLEDNALSLDEAAKKAHELGAVMGEDAIDSAAEFQGAMDELKQVGQGLIRDFAIPFMNALVDRVLPALKEDVVPALKSVADWVERNSGVVLKATTVLVGMAAAIKVVNIGLKVYRGLVVVVTAVTKAWAAATKVSVAATKAMTVAQRALNLAMRMNPIGIVITILFALGAAIVAAWKKSETFRRIVKGAWDAVKSGAVSMKDWIVSAWDTVVGKVRGAASRIGGFLSGIWDGVTSGARSALNGAISLINSAVGGINALIDGANKVPGVSIPSVPTIPHLARGGRALAGMAHIVGEEGPELFVPERNGRVIPNNKLGAGTGGLHVENLNVKAVGPDFSLKNIHRRLALQAAR